VVSVGVEGIALISAITKSKDPQRTTKQLLNLI
jgi:thiamine monophosphate synthase